MEGLDQREVRAADVGLEQHLRRESSDALRSVCLDGRGEGETRIGVAAFDALGDTVRMSRGPYRRPGISCTG
jgi:hypothetical protein